MSESVPKHQFKIDECVILGSGRSLLDLSDSEKAHLSNHPCTIALNKFLIFHEKIGIVPKNVLLTDTHHPAPRVLVDLLTIATALPTLPHFFLNERYRWLFEPRATLRSLPRRFRRRWKHYRRHGYWLPLATSYPNITYVKPYHKNASEFFWAEHPGETLYFYRGTLTTAINLCTVEFRPRRIKLVGVDLDSHLSFFAEELDKLPQYRDAENDPVAEKMGRHSTSVGINGYEPIQTVLPQIVAHLADRGTELVCCNHQSLLCQQNICTYRPIIES